MNIFSQRIMMFRFGFIFVLALLASCSSTTRDYKGVYEATHDIGDITVPPGLDTPQVTAPDEIAKYGGNVKTYSRYSEQQQLEPKTRFAQEYKGMRFVRSGSLFWLEVEADGDQVWDDIRDFFIKLGFEIKSEQPRLGYMETSWLENKVDIPTGFLAELLSGLYSTELMDRYRIRLEWDAKQKLARVFINHQGLQEVQEGGDNLSGIITKWIPRDSDPELEIEMITRFMAYRGQDEDVAEKQIASVKYKSLSKIKEEDKATTLTINTSFSRAWRHVGIAIDRLGYLVEDKNRSAGVYYIALPETFVIPKEGGFFGSLFTDTAEAQHKKYLLILEDQGDKTLVRVKANGDVPEDMDRVTAKILKDIKSSIL